MNDSLSQLLNNIGKKESKDRSVYVRLSASEFFLLETHCHATYKNYSEVIRIALDQYLNKNK